MPMKPLPFIAASLLLAGCTAEVPRAESAVECIEAYYNAINRGDYELAASYVMTESREEREYALSLLEAMDQQGCYTIGETRIESGTSPDQCFVVFERIDRRGKPSPQRVNCKFDPEKGWRGDLLMEL